MNIRLNLLNDTQIRYYDDLITKLSKQIIDKSLRFEIVINASPKNYKKEINQLVSAANNSKILHPKHADICKNFTTILDNKILPFLDDQTAELMLPVFFFAAILQNEYTHNTVRKRAQRGGKNWGITDDLLTNIEIEKPLDKDQQNTFNGICKDFEIALQHYEDTFKEKSTMIHTVLDHALDARELVNSYQKIVEIQNYANVGLLALNILEELHISSNPMLTIIRMLIIDEICGVLTFCEKLSNNFPIASNTEGNLMYRYYYNGGPKLDRQVSKHGLGYIRKAKDIKRVDLSYKAPILLDENIFLQYKKYNHIRLREEFLYAMPLTNKDVLEVKKYYLDRAQLEWYSGFYVKVTEYVKNITVALNNACLFEKKYGNTEKYYAFLREQEQQ